MKCTVGNKEGSVTRAMTLREQEEYFKTAKIISEEQLRQKNQKDIDKKILGSVIDKMSSNLSGSEKDMFKKAILREI